ncbi:MAG: polA [Parcubacteria group bacterium]|nr:polA [Parcubacteria group bacterium]
MAKKSDKKRLVILDSHAIIHRAYHALPDFTGPDGAPTGALYGLASMLLRIFGDLKPDYIAAAYDLAGPTVRHEAYAEYKGTRTKSDDALIAQLTTSRDVFAAFSVPIYERAGFEADDVLGTIVKMLEKDPNIEIIIASGDMDTMQLIDGKKVQVYTLKKGLNDTILYDEQAVIDRYGFAPEMISDYKGLRGDPSDNIKGVPGIGEKTATDLIQNFGTIENLYKILKKDEQALLDKGIKPRIIGLLKEHEEDALFSKMLATIRDDAPVAFKIPKEEWTEEVKLPRILELFDKLGFRSLRGRAQSLLAAGGEEDGDLESVTEISEASIPHERLEEAKVMLWLLCSEYTNPNVEDVLGYAGKQTFDEAYDELARSLTETGRLQTVFDEMERPLIKIIDEMKAHGILIDTNVLSKLAKEYRGDLEIIEQRIYKAAGREFNIASPKQLGEILFDELELKTPGAKSQKKTATGQRSTKESELEKLRELHPIIEDILEYRGLAKLLGTYIDSIPPLLDEKSRLHAQFLQYGAVTGRMASEKPGLQNIPIRTERGRAIRGAFRASPGHVLLGLDYSQIELRLAAILSKDEKLIEIFKSGRDVHREVAAAVFGVAPEAVDPEMRRRAKIINFGILYGMGVNALKAQLGTSVGEAHQFYEDYFTTFATLAKYLESTRGYARKNGFTETLFGRRRQFPEMKSPLPYVRAQAERMAINAPIQGTQADLIKLAMVHIDEMLTAEDLHTDVHLLLQVHDELVYEIKEEKLKELCSKIKHLMESVLAASETEGVPIIAEMKSGQNWGDAVPFALE